MYDVAVVGAGPAGSYVAQALAEKGHRVVVVERHLLPGTARRCTGIVGRECFHRFSSLERALFREARSAKLFSPSGELLRLEKDAPQAYIVDRPALDLLLAESAQAAGASYLLGSRVEGINRRDGRLILIADGGGGSLTLEARAVVIASGFGSALPQQLGLSQVADFLIGAQVEVQAPQIEEVEVYFGREVAPGSFAWLVPTAAGGALAGLLSRQPPGPYLERLLDRLRAQGKISSVEGKVVYGGIPLAPLPRTYADGALVVGDAAGQVKPTTGGGIYYSLLCAEMAAASLHRALSEGDLSARCLAGYQRAWRKRLGGELRLGRYARKLFEMLSDTEMERLFRLVLSDGLPQALLDAEGFSFDWHGGLILWGLRHRVLGRALLSMTRSVLPF